MRTSLILIGFATGCGLLALNVGIHNGEFHPGMVTNAGAPLLFMGGVIGAVLGLVVSFFLPKKRDD